MVKNIKLVLVSIAVAILLALASSVAIPGSAVLEDSSFEVMEMMAGPAGSGGSAS